MICWIDRGNWDHVVKSFSDTASNINGNFGELKKVMNGFCSEKCVDSNFVLTREEGED